MFPRILDGAKVLYYTEKNDFGVVANVDGSDAEYICYLAVCQYPNDTGYYLFLCDKKEIRITPVLYGLAKGQKPFIEIHNPTDKKLFCQVTVPVDAPEFGGMKIQAEIPAGSSVFKEFK